MSTKTKVAYGVVSAILALAAAALASYAYFEATWIHTAMYNPYDPEVSQGFPLSLGKDIGMYKECKQILKPHNRNRTCEYFHPLFIKPGDTSGPRRERLAIYRAWPWATSGLVFSWIGLFTIILSMTMQKLNHFLSNVAMLFQTSSALATAVSVVTALFTLGKSIPRRWGYDECRYYIGCYSWHHDHMYDIAIGLGMLLLMPAVLLYLLSAVILAMGVRKRQAKSIQKAIFEGVDDKII